MRKIGCMFLGIMMCIMVLFLGGCESVGDGLFITSGLPETLERGEDLNTDKVIATLRYDDGKHIELTSKDLEFGQIDTDTVGRKSLKVKYKDYEVTVYIDVVEKESVNMLSLLESGLSVFEENRLSMLGSDEGESKMYYVGDDNPFDLRLKVAGVNASGDVIDDLSEYEVEFDIMLRDNNVDTLLSDEDITKYVSVNDDHTLDFTEEAIDKEFSVVVKAINYIGSQQPKVILPLIKVVDGYNAYDAEDISLIENTGENGWGEKKSNEMMILSKDIRGIILHDTITILDEDIPNQYFYSQDEVSKMSGVTAIDGAKGVKIEGSLKDEMSGSWTSIFRRVMTAGDEFNIYGNYNLIDASQISRVVIAGEPSSASVNDVISVSDPTKPESGIAITPHASLIKFDTHIVGNVPQVYICNTSMIGNGARSSSAYNSGGLILAKLQGVDSLIERTSYYDFLIGYMYEAQNEVRGEQDMASHILKTTKGENCYSSLIYNWASKDLMIEDCELLGAGGPVMIVDYKVDKDDSSNEWIPTVTIVNSKLESFVTGNEPWFTTYGAGALLSQITPAEAFYNGATYNESAGQGIPDTGKNFLVARKQGTSTIEDMLNCVCVFKDASAEGITPNRIKGSISIYNTREDYENDKKVYGLDCPLELGDVSLTDKAMKKNVVYFESSETGGYFNTGLISGDTDTSLYSGTHYVSSNAQKEYVNLYLMNGMGLIFELFPVTK